MWQIIGDRVRKKEWWCPNVQVRAWSTWKSIEGFLNLLTPHWPAGSRVSTSFALASREFKSSSSEARGPRVSGFHYGPLTQHGFLVAHCAVAQHESDNWASWLFGMTNEPLCMEGTWGQGHNLTHTGGPWPSPNLRLQRPLEWHMPMWCPEVHTGEQAILFRHWIQIPQC